MVAPPRQRSFSAKTHREARPGPPRKKPHDPKRRDYLRPDEVEAMVQAARTSGRHRVRDAAIILLMFRHGLRTAELVALRWHQVDLKGGYLDVHRVKRGHHAKHPLRGPQLRLLRELLRTYPGVLDVRRELFTHMLRQSAAFFSKRTTGELLSRLTNDVTQIQMAVSETLADLTRESMTAPLDSSDRGDSGQVGGVALCSPSPPIAACVRVLPGLSRA